MPLNQQTNEQGMLLQPRFDRSIDGSTGQPSEIGVPAAASIDQKERKASNIWSVAGPMICRCLAPNSWGSV